MSEKDHLDGAVSIEAALTESGVKASAKSRFVVAIDRLLGGLLDWPASYVDGKAQLRRLENELALKARAESAAIDIHAATELQRLKQAAAIAIETEAVRKRLNTQMAIVEALEDLRQDPPIDEASGVIEDDWLNVYASYAEKASSDRLRELWGKVLSGEVRSPGTFSLTTLRILSELDQQTASLFMGVLNRIYAEKFLVLDGKLEGDFLVDVITLEELGFLQYSGGLTLPVNFDEKGEAFVIAGENILLMKGVPNSNFRFNVAKLTRSGLEILRLISRDDSDLALRKILDQGDGNISSAEITVVIERNDGGVRYKLPATKLK